MPTGAYRATVNGFAVMAETWDDALELGGPCSVWEGPLESGQSMVIMQHVEYRIRDETLWPFSRPTARRGRREQRRQDGPLGVRQVRRVRAANVGHASLQPAETRMPTRLTRDTPAT
jgi:hypothetical protein